MCKMYQFYKSGKSEFAPERSIDFLAVSKESNLLSVKFGAKIIQNSEILKRTGCKDKFCAVPLY